MNNRKGMWIAISAVLAGIVLIFVGSIYAAPSGMSLFNIGFAGFSESKQSVNEQEFEAKDIKNIDINSSSYDVVLLRGEDDTVIVKEYVDGNENKFGQIKLEGETLVYKQNKKRWIHFGFHYRDERVEVYLPESYEGKIEIATSSGEIKVEEEWKAEKFEVSSSSGDIKIASVLAEKIAASSSSGEISFGKAEGNKSISTSSGDINIGEGRGAGKYSTSSGSINVSGTSGEIKATTSSGDVSLEIAKLEDDVNVSTSSGEIEIEIPSESSFSYAGDSGSGGINTSFDEDLTYNKKRNHAEGKVGEKSPIEISTSTSSGDTTITTAK